MRNLNAQNYFQLEEVTKILLQGRFQFLHSLLDQLREKVQALQIHRFSHRTLFGVETASFSCAVPALLLRYNGDGRTERTWSYWEPGYQDFLQFWQSGCCCINDSFIDLNYMMYMFQYNAAQRKFYIMVKTENRKLVNNGKAITLFQEQDPTNIK
ncbi:hypothetical protein I79_018711 [Cricetulus griseus]|uniref:Glyceraldehyde 3-phosphate dehydrogenase NAD(P) binding domain-containing protein n=1 Tax=Cricetulus griseus TaxID=10029 RepID=G3I5G3_CRIGR|nr:hypothetical protein I79_018711 [Cricetulus griseus]